MKFICITRSFCSLSLSKISSFLICTFNSSFFLSISNSAIELDSCILLGGRRLVVVCVPSSGVVMLIDGVVSAYCAVSTGIGTFGCSDTPGRKVVRAGGAASFVSFAYPWVTGVSINDTVSGATLVGLVLVRRFS